MHTSSLKLKQSKRSILKNARIQQRLNTSAHQIITIKQDNDIQQIYPRHKQLKHKTFFEFIDQNPQIIKNKLKRINPTNLSTLVVSYDNKIQPIHRKFSLGKQRINFNINKFQVIQKQMTYKPIINKIQNNIKQKQKYHKLYQLTKQFNQDQSIKFIKKPIIKKQIRFYSQENQVKNIKFDCRPWTRRIDGQHCQHHFSNQDYIIQNL